jgi:hypothetical protein
MAQFEKNSWGYYEIDFYNYATEEEKRILHSFGLNDFSCYFKDGPNWTQRISGMTFNFKSHPYYAKLAKYLDDRLKIYLRKEKLKQLNDTVKRKRNP